MLRLHMGSKFSLKYENVDLEHSVITYWGSETQTIIIMTTGVKHVILVNTCTVNVTKDDRDFV
jgi:hypothetical protein